MTEPGTTADPAAVHHGPYRDRLAISLDVDDAVAAQRLALELRPWFGVVKIGLELFCAAGPDIVAEMLDDGYKVFLDLKLGDIPTTVNRAARVLGALGVSYLTVHASMGEASLRAGVEGLADGAAKAGLPAPVTLAVTVLTSDAESGPDILATRIDTAVAAGAGGVVCPARAVATVKERAPGLVTAVPGTRPAGFDTHDHAHPATPAEAIAAGADLLVVGRAVTAQTDRTRAAADFVAGLD
jgi:orotidine-5'-phosphate decarboxylase